MQYNEEKIPIKVHNFLIDSRSRNKNVYPDASRYAVNIATPFKNVVKVELANAIYERNGQENFVYLNIDELDGNLETNNNEVRGSFTQLPLLHSVNNYNSGITHFRSVRLFERPLARLARMSISFLNHDGSLYPMQDHALRFEITTCKNDASIENRNMDVFGENYTVYVPSAAPFPPPATPMAVPPLPHSMLTGQSGKSVLVPPLYHHN